MIFNYRHICLLSLLVVSSLFFYNFPALAETAQVASVPELKEIFLGKTVLFEAEKDFNRIVVGDAKIASVRAISRKQILIKGYRPGWTNLIIWHNDNTLEIYDFRVKIDPKMISDVENLIKKLVPASAVRLVPANQELLLEGEVESMEDMQRVLQIVSAFFSAKKKKKGEEGEEGRSSTTINVGTGKGGYDTGEDEGQLEQNLDLTVAIRNNLIIIKGAQQVQLEVKIAEVSRSNMKKLGLGFLNNNDWSIGVFPAGSVSGKMTGGNPIREETNIDIINQTISQTTSGGDVLESVAEIASPFGAAFQVLLHSSSDDSLAILSLLKGQGIARMLATPTLVTMNGQTASFNVGGEFPVPTTDSEGQTSVTYKEYGVILRFTPTIVGRETITLNVSPEVSEPDWSVGTASGGVAVPGVKTRKSHSTLQLKDGQTFVMAGLLKEDSYTVINKIPFLGDIPIIGTLFTSKEYQKKETELVIIVTPRLVKPLNKAEVPPLPGGDIMDNVSDIDFFLLNRTIRNAGTVNKNRSEKTQPAFAGEMGFER